MKIRYGIHPKEFAIGETEKYYSDMAAKGWQLVKRGVTFSKFEKTEPKKMRYRVEVVAPKMLDGNGNLPTEQVAVYEDCGWEYVDSKGFLHVFRAPEGSDAPEFYLEPEQQAGTLKSLRGKYIGSLLSPFLYIGVFMILSLMVGNFSGSKWAAELYISWVENSAGLSALGIAFVWLLFSDIWGLFYVSRLYHQMKKGIPLNHEPKSKDWIRITLSAVLLIAAIGCIIYDFTGDHTYKMQNNAHGPYILLSDLGYEGERTTNIFNHEESKVHFNHSIAAQHWSCQEFLKLSESDDIWMYQDVYLMPSEAMIDRMVEALMITSTFSRSVEHFTEIDVPGLDQAYANSRLECIAVKGNMIWMITLPSDTQTELIDVLTVIAEKQN